jgi:hypothetical protein
MMTQSPSEPENHYPNQSKRSDGVPWIAGVILVLLGGAFLLQNLGLFSFSFDNWWALFLLIPAIGSFETAARIYQNSGSQWTIPARNSILVGLVLLLVTAAFLLNLSWRVFGPVLMLLAGGGILVNSISSKK